MLLKYLFNSTMLLYRIQNKQSYFDYTCIDTSIYTISCLLLLHCLFDFQEYILYFLASLLAPPLDHVYKQSSLKKLFRTTVCLVLDKGCSLYLYLFLLPEALLYMTIADEMYHIHTYLFELCKCFEVFSCEFHY